MAYEDTKRHFFIDWLRVLAILTVFIFHCAIFFSFNWWHVKNNEVSFNMEVFTKLLSHWLMPLFFLLAAIASYCSLEKRSVGQYIRERFKRLAVPFIFGSLIFFAPVQVWIQRVTEGDFSGSFIEFYFPHYFEGMYGFGGNFAWMGLHLWYLEMLFIFSVITLPIFILIKSKKITDIISRFADHFKYIGCVLFAVAIIATELLVNLEPKGIGMREFGGWSLPTYLVIFVLGFIIASNDNFMKSIEKRRKVSLIMYLITTALVILFKLEKLSTTYFIFYTLLPFSSWCALLTIVGFAKKYLSAPNIVLGYCNEAVLPFYILHQTVIVIIGYYIKDWNLAIMVKYVFLLITSFIVIMLIYVIIKRINALRFLFGMKRIGILKGDLTRVNKNVDGSRSSY